MILFSPVYVPKVLRFSEYYMRDKIKLVSTAGTGHFYTSTKNKRTKPEKLEMKKFDPVIRRHVLYREAKIK